MGKERGWWETLALIRLHIISEGQTEEGLINNILAPMLGAQNVFADTHRITTGRRYGHIMRGGLVNYDHLARDLILWMKQDQSEDSWFTTIVDFYNLPTNFPGHATIPNGAPAADRVTYLETEFRKDIIQRLDELPVSRRFIPYIQLHEFEALLFSDPGGFAGAFPSAQKAIDKLIEIRSQFSSPEDIDDGPTTSPSKRILAVLHDYQKPVHGLLVAQQIGAEKIRNECKRFGGWLKRLEELNG